MADTTKPAPSQRHPVVDRFRRWTPEWYRFLGPLLKTVRETASSAANNSAAITTEQTVRAAADTALASQLTTVQTQVNGNSASIQTLTESVDGIEARWAVSININGEVVGLVKLDGSSTESTFDVVADKFRVSQPSVTGGAATQVFEIGTVAGSPALVLRGNFIADGAILARAIDVDELSAIVANIGTVTAGKMQSADGKVVFDLDAKTLVMTT